jgi:hypothetical protein
MCLQVYIAFSPPGKEQISARSDLEVSDTPTLTARVDLHAAFGVPAAGMHCPLRSMPLKTRICDSATIQEAAGSLDGNFFWGSADKPIFLRTTLSYALPWLLPVWMPLSSRERDFLGTSNFRLYQTYLRIQVMRRVVPHRNTPQAIT